MFFKNNDGIAFVGDSVTNMGNSSAARGEGLLDYFGR